MRNPQLVALLTSPDCFATTLLVWAMDQYHDPDGDDPEPLFSWDPQTIRLEIEQDLGRKLPDLNFDKLMAAMQVRVSDDFYRSLPRFIQLVNALVGDGFQPTVWDPAETAECCWGISEACLLRRPDEEEPFSEEIRHYLAWVLKEEGYASPPDVLRIAIGADVLEQLRYEYSDDPVMFNAIYDTQRAKTQEVEQQVQENLIELVAQLQQLPLRYGKTDQLTAAAAQLGKRLSTA